MQISAAMVRLSLTISSALKCGAYFLSAMAADWAYILPDPMAAIEKIAETIRNFLILAEELSLSQIGEFLYQECLKLNIELGVVRPTDIKKRHSTFKEEPFLPFPAYQSI
jgi:hypothetical protein